MFNPVTTGCIKHISRPRCTQVQCAGEQDYHAYMQGFFSGKRGAGTHKRGKDKHTKSFVTILLSCSPTS
jgi:hypothetical protein